MRKHLALGWLSKSAAICLTVFSLACSAAYAQKGGKGGSTPTTHRLVPLETTEGSALAMTEATTLDGKTSVSLVGWLGEDAWYWRVTTSMTGQDQVQSLPLLLPPNAYPDFPTASGEAINADGLIVGSCRLLNAGPGQPLMWEDELADPMPLPLPTGFTGWAMPRAINRGGVIVGEYSGDQSNGVESNHVEGLIVWYTWVDEEDRRRIGPPTCFPMSVPSLPQLNDAGWVAFDNLEGDYRIRLTYQWVANETLGYKVPEFSIGTVDGPLFGSDKVASVGGINQAGDVAGTVRTINQPGQDLYVKRLDGSFLNMPVYINDRTYGTYVLSVTSINDATLQHAVQALGRAGVYYKKSPSSIGWRGWALWEAGGSVRLLHDITDVPSDSAYYFTSTPSNFYDLNDASWVCGRIARGSDRVGVPAVLVRKP
jgi:hypothetical protein